ncbi:MAG: hypothetical protein AB7U73_01585, partial [Pirellulales bacterium]
MRGALFPEFDRFGFRKPFVARASNPHHGWYAGSKKRLAFSLLRHQGTATHGSLAVGFSAIVARTFFFFAGSSSSLVHLA